MYSQKKQQLAGTKSFFLPPKHNKIIRVRRLKKEQNKNNIKWYISINVSFKKEDKTAEPVFRGHCQVSTHQEDIQEGFQDSAKKIYESFTEYQREGSNWTLDHLVNLTLNIGKYRPLRGNSYLKLPTRLANKKAIINVKNLDEKCFLWAVLSALYPASDHPDRIAKYFQYENTLDMSGKKSKAAQKILGQRDQRKQLSFTR